MDKPLLVSSTSDGTCSFLLRGTRYSYSGIDGLAIPDIRKINKHDQWKAFNMAQKYAMFMKKDNGEWEMTPVYRWKSTPIQ